MLAWLSNMGIMAYPLGLCSVAGLMICFERCVFFIFGSSRKKQEFDSLKQLINRYKSATKSLRENHLSLALQQLQHGYNAGLKTLRIIATLSPMLGLLGTIIGIIEAFQIIANHTGSVSPSLIAGGLWQAMLTTLVGLAIALPCLLAVHIFKHLGEQHLQMLTYELNLISLSFEENETTNNPTLSAVAA